MLSSSASKKTQKAQHVLSQQKLAINLIKVQRAGLDNALTNKLAFGMILRNRVGKCMTDKSLNAITDTELVERCIRSRAMDCLQILCPYDKYNKQDHLVNCPPELIFNPAHFEMVSYFFYNRDVNVLQHQRIGGTKQNIEELLYRAQSLVCLLTSKQIDIGSRIVFLRTLLKHCPFERSNVSDEKRYASKYDRFVRRIWDEIQMNHRYLKKPFGDESQKNSLGKVLLEELSDIGLELIICLTDVKPQAIFTQHIRAIQKDEKKNDLDGINLDLDIDYLMKKCRNKVQGLVQSSLPFCAIQASEVYSERVNRVAWKLKQVTSLPNEMILLICSFLSPLIVQAVHPLVNIQQPSISSSSSSSSIVSVVAATVVPRQHNDQKKEEEEKSISPSADMVQQDQDILMASSDDDENDSDSTSESDGEENSEDSSDDNTSSESEEEEEDEQEMKKKKTVRRHRRGNYHWSSSQLQQLMELRSDGATFSHIARVLGSGLTFMQCRSKYVSEKKRFP
jgi:hypothetical protein